MGVRRRSALLAGFLFLVAAGGAQASPASGAAAETAHEAEAAAPEAETETDEGSHKAAHEGETAASSWPTERAPMPFEVIRSLQFLQDQAARGNKAALNVQRRLLAHFGASLTHRDPAIWTDGRNVRAAALFILSGGPSAPVEDLLASKAFAPEDEPLIRGVVAYSANRIEEARNELAKVDLRFGETIFVAQLELVLAQLLEASDPAKALDHLERVMLAAPGTLLEEAALRLGVLLADGLGETQTADRYARQYFDRYAASVYAGNFSARFAAVYSARPAGPGDATLQTLSDVLRLLPEDQQLAIYLSVSRRALVGGNLELSAETARRALQFADAAPGDRQRALLYETASTISGREAIEALTALSAIDDAQLHPADKALKDAALDVLDAIRRPAQVADAEGANVPLPNNRTMARASSLLNAVDDDLRSFGQ